MRAVSPSVSVTQRHRCRRCDALPTENTYYRPLRIHIERVETMATSHEKTVSLAATEAKIRAPLGQRDAANRLALGIKDHHPIEVRTPHSPTGPDIAVHVATKTIWRSGAGVDQHPAGPEMAPIDHVEHADLAVRYRAGLDDIKAHLVGRETQSIRPQDVVGRDSRFARQRVDSIDVGVQFRLGNRSLVKRAKAKGRVGEPDRPVGGDDDIVRRVEPLALKTVDDDGDRPVVLGARHATGAVLARDEPTRSVARVAVGVA